MLRFSDPAGSVDGSRKRRRRSCLPLPMTASAPRLVFTRLNSPARAYPYRRFAAALADSRRTARGHRGSLVLRCRAFSSPSPSRFIPALSIGRSRNLMGRSAGPGVARDELRGPHAAPSLAPIHSAAPSPQSRRRLLLADVADQSSAIAQAQEPGGRPARSLRDERDHRAPDRGMIAIDGEQSCAAAGRRDRFATASVVSPPLADGCFSPAMQKPSRSRRAASTALLLSLRHRPPTSGPEQSSRLDRPRDRFARKPPAEAERSSGVLARLL